MSAYPPPAEERCAFCSQFVSAMQAVKALHTLMVSIMADLSALRRTVLINPELQEIYRQRLEDASAIARPILAEAMECYEAMISDAEVENGTGKCGSLRCPIREKGFGDTV